jgi:two-component system sensor histidine kinase RegB
MPGPRDSALARTARRLRLATLVRLRWLAVAGQAVAVATVYYGLGLPLPLTWCFLLISLSAWLNIGLSLRYPQSHRLGDRPAFILLTYDLLQLSGLLALTGGLQNPFSIMLLVPVMISATALSVRYTFALGVLAVATASLLALWHLPLPWPSGTPLSLPVRYMVGIWLALLLSIAFTGIYAWRVAEEAHTLAQALVATELVLAREQHLHQLDGLAAAAAHELGTPMATIALVVGELRKSVAAQGENAADIALLSEQVERCRTILGTLTSLHTDPASPSERLSIEQLVAEVSAFQASSEVQVDVSFTGAEPMPVCNRNPGISYGLSNIVENACDFASRTVTLHGFWTDKNVVVEISDDGPGFAPAVLLRAGDPYLSLRDERTRATGGGLGLGLFIAKTLLERSGATLRLANRPFPQKGASVSVIWPRKVFDIGMAGPVEAPPPLAIARPGTAEAIAADKITAN